VFSFIETKLFPRLLQEYLTDDEYRKLPALLIEQREAGTLSRVLAESTSCVGGRMGRVNAVAIV
jgi:hypothetical protein